MPSFSQEVRNFILACEVIQARLAQGDRLTADERQVIEFSALDLLVHEFLDPIRSNFTALAVEAQDVGKADADAGQARRQIENFTELPVPANQL